MTPVEQVNDILDMMHSEGGLGIVYMSAMVNDIALEAEKGNGNAIQFMLELTHVHGLLKAAIAEGKCYDG
jgi:hypothetical protein